MQKMKIGSSAAHSTVSNMKKGIGGIFLVIVLALVTFDISHLNEQASKIQTAIDEKIVPCQDFYNYACGNWIRTHTIPKDKSSISKSFTKIRDENRVVIRSILEQEWPLLGEFYSSCMNVSELNRLGTTVIQDMYTRMDEMDNKFDLLKLAGEYSMVISDFVVGTGVRADKQGEQKLNIVYLSQSSLGLPSRDYYLNKTKYQGILEGYRLYIRKLFTSMGEKDAMGIADTIMDAETRLAEISIDKEVLRNPSNTYNVVKLEQLKDMAPLFVNAYLVGAEIQLHNTSVVVESVSFLKNAQRVVMDLPLDTLKLWLKYNVVSGFAATMDEPTFAIYFDFYGKLLSGQQKMAPRWRHCSDKTVTYLGELSSRYYVMQKFIGNSKNVSETMVQEIENALKAKIKEADWMDEDTKLKAIEKLGLMSNLIGHPDYKLKYPFMLNEDTYFENKVKILKWNHRKAIAKIGNPVDRSKWYMHASDVNAYYSQANNQIVFPAGILQEPFFKYNYLPAINYGAIGVVIAHELTHGFDDAGRKYDGLGNLKSWWSNETTNEFNKRAQCWIDQYSEFQMLNGTQVIGNINGNLTIGENIGNHHMLLLRTIF